MIAIQKRLSPILASLLCKEFPRSPCWLLESAPDVLEIQSEKSAIDRFHVGLDAGQLDLRSDASGGQQFCEVAICYLEALLDPAEVNGMSGIKATAMAAKDTWDHLTESERQALILEAADLHAAIEPMADMRSPDHELQLRPPGVPMS